ncbi:MAG: helix-turn-helix transcriptional regulator [Deltaproteobacteria bacterium]|nr:helix-turn-helix transcriptional regulator [Deltaproteobacteria bacterium]
MKRMTIEKDYEKLIKRIALNIKHIREKRSLTQEGMGQFGFNYRFYQRVESGKYSFNLYTLHRLSKVFRVRITEFFR